MRQVQEDAGQPNNFLSPHAVIARVRQVVSIYNELRSNPEVGDAADDQGDDGKGQGDGKGKGQKGKGACEGKKGKG